MKNKGAAVDSILLTFVRVITALISMVISKVLSVGFSIQEMGIYSSAMLIVTTITSITILGLTDAVNYYYNRTNDRERKEQYVATIFCIQFIVGIVFALAVVLGRSFVARFFDNDSVIILIPYIALMPLLNNLMNMLQILFVSSGKSKTIAVRNLVISLAKIAYVVIVAFFVKDIKFIVICLLIVDLIAVIYMWIYAHRKLIRIDFKKTNKAFIKPILSYSIPMAGYVITNSLSRNMDKWIIAKFGGSSTLAVYTIASKELPFDMLTMALVTVLIPYITKYVANEDYDNAGKTFSSYIKLCYLITWPMAFAALVASRELMLILYDSKYLIGLNIFVVYLFVDMVRFANVSLIFSAKGKTRELLVYSCSALVANLILNVGFYKIMGSVGPAISTLVIMVMINSIMLFRSSHIISHRLIEIIDIKSMISVAFELIVFGVAVVFVFSKLDLKLSYIILFLIKAAIVAVPVYLLNVKKIIGTLKNINQLKM